MNPTESLPCHASGGQTDKKRISYMIHQVVINEILGKSHSFTKKDHWVIFESLCLTNHLTF